MQKIDLTQTKDVDKAYQSQNYDEIRAKYNDDGTQYAFDVLDGKILAGYMIKLACFRHLQDLKRAENRIKDFPYHYSMKECHNILKFASICPDTDTGEPINLLPWQRFIMCQLMGWRDDKNKKRFTNVIVSVARANGKTYFASIILCYSFLIESMGQSNQDYLVTAPTYKQSSKLFGYIKGMLKKVTTIEPFKTFSESVALQMKKDEIIENANNNVLRLISYESNQYDSYHFRTAVFDEIGDIDNDEQTSKITSGQVKVDNHQYIQISTAYPNVTSPFRNDQTIAQQTMEQDWSRKGDNTLCLVWSQDSLDEVFEPKTWIKSNPLLSLKSQSETLLDGLKNERDTLTLKGRINDFQIKNMNMWLQESTNSYLKLADIEKTKISHFDIRHKTVYMGFDYSMFSDNTSIAFIVPYMDQNKQKKWYLAQHSFIPWYKAGSIEAKEKQDGINYRDLAKKGFCTITSHPQGMINEDQVYQWIVDYVIDNDLKVIFFGYDAMGVNAIIKNLEMNTSWPLEAIRQRTSELKDPTKFIQRAFAEGNVTHLNDPIMEKALTNAQIYEDKIGIQVDKAKATLKIDAVDALIDAMYQAMYHFEDFSLVNDKSKEVEYMSEDDVKAWFESEESGLLDEFD